MKIFNNENGVEKIYVQQNDLKILFDYEEQAIPHMIFQKFFTEIGFFDSETLMEFIEFDDPIEVDFFKNLNWLIDYNDYIQLDNRELKFQTQSISQEIAKILENYDNTEDEEEKYWLLQECNLKKYMLECINEIFELKIGQSEIVLPNFSEKQIKENFLKKLLKKDKN